MGVRVSTALTAPDPLLRSSMVTESDTIRIREPFRSSKYTLEDCTRAFAILHMCGGNYMRAERQMQAQAEDGSTSVSVDTLKAWVTKYPARYSHVGEVFKDVAEQAVVVALRDLQTAATQASIAAVELELERIQKGDVKDAGAAAQRLATVAGIATDKVLSLTGRPQSIVQHRSGADILRELQSLGQATIEDTPPDVEVVVGEPE